MLSAEGCSQVHVYLTSQTLKTQISTCCSRSTIVYWPKEGVTDEQLNDKDNWMCGAVPEVFTTKLDDKRQLQTEGYLGEE